MQPANECGCKDILIIGGIYSVGLEITDVRLEAVILLYFDGENVVIVLLSLPARGVLSEERFVYFHEIVDRMLRQ